MLACVLSDHCFVYSVLRALFLFNRVLLIIKFADSEKELSYLFVLLDL